MEKYCIVSIKTLENGIISRCASVLSTHDTKDEALEALRQINPDDFVQDQLDRIFRLHRGVEVLRRDLVYARLHDADENPCLEIRYAFELTREDKKEPWSTNLRHYITIVPMLFD